MCINTVKTVHRRNNFYKKLVSKEICILRYRFKKKILRNLGPENVKINLIKIAHWMAPTIFKNILCILEYAEIMVTCVKFMIYYIECHSMDYRGFDPFFSNFFSNN